MKVNDKMIKQYLKYIDWYYSTELVSELKKRPLKEYLENGIEIECKDLNFKLTKSFKSWLKEERDRVFKKYYGIDFEDLLGD